MRREIHDEALIEAAVQAAVDAWVREPTGLLQVLREVQESLGFLPPPSTSTRSA